METMSPGPPLVDSPQSELERQLIRQYLRDKGYESHDLHALPKGQANALYRQACRYAALKLAEVEARAQFRHKIRYEGR